MDNLKEFKALIKRYESITIEEIENSSDDLFYDPQDLTGFGGYDTCTLCDPLNNRRNLPDCTRCMWVIKTEYMCVLDENKETYEGIEGSDSNTELLNAFKARAEYMKTVLKIKT